MSSRIIRSTFVLGIISGVFGALLFMVVTSMAFAADAPVEKPSDYAIGIEVGAIIQRMRVLENEYKQLEATKVQLEAMREKKPEAAPVKGAKQ